MVRRAHRPDQGRARRLGTRRFSSPAVVSSPAPDATMAALSPAAIESLAGKILASASLGPHAVFSLRADAGRDAFKARYRELARALHPDKAKSRAAEEAFKVVTESFRAVAAAGTDRSRVGRGGTLNPDDGPRENRAHNRAPFWRVRGEDAAAAPPRWSAAANGSSANASSSGAYAFEKKQPERYSGARYDAPSDANASGATREASPSPVTHVEPNERFVERFENGAGSVDDTLSTDPARSPTRSRTRAWFDLDRGGANDARVASKVTSNPKTTHGRWNDSPRGHAVFVPSTVPSARVFGNGDDPYGDLEDAPDLDDDGFAEDSVFGGEKVWATGPSGAEPRAKGGADFRGWGDAAAGRAARTHRRGAWSAAPKTRAPLAASRASRAPGADFRGFDVADVGDPSELERLACGGNEENEPESVSGLLEGAKAPDAVDENGAARRSPRAAESDAEAGLKKRKRGRAKKAATSVPSAPRPRLAALDEPRIPHTKLPRKKFAQATLAFS